MLYTLLAAVTLLSPDTAVAGDAFRPPADPPAPAVSAWSASSLPAPAGGDRTYPGAEGELLVSTPRILDGGLDVDGIVDEAVWDRAALLTAFTQYDPVEGVAASQRTEVLVFVTDEHIHFGIRAFDDDPGSIRATLAERDNVARSDDYVRVVLDTFDDQRRAWVFTVNPLGVQQDGLWVEGGGGRRGFGDPIDDNPDFLWESGGAIHDWGWSAEIRVPFKSLRFPDRDVQRWGLNVLRRIQRNGFQSSWAPLTANVSNKLTQAGALDGLQDLDPGLFLEINPVVTGRRVGLVDDDTGLLEREDPDADFGLNLTYGLTSNLTLDATYNPDFSQVEADAGQIVVNERFALFFPEKRPFFLEGTEVFSLPRQLVYTRSVVNPLAGAKVTGKVGGLTLGYLGALDEVSDADDALVNLVRLRGDVGRSSTAGLVFTDRTAGDDFNRVGAADARLVFGGRNTLSLLGALSWTGAPEEDDARGSFLFAGFERSGRGFSFEAGFEDVAEDFEARSGFIRRTGDTQMNSTVRYNVYGPSGALLERVGPYVELRGVWDRERFWDGEPIEERDVQLGFSASLRGNISAFLNWTRSRFLFPAADYEGLYVGDGSAAPAPFRPDQDLFGGLDAFSLRGFFSPWERVRGNAQIEVKEVPIFESSLDVPVAPGDAWGGELSLTLLPTRSLRAEVGIRHETIHRDDGSRYSSATIPRIRAQYQFSRALFLRAIAEYGSQEREALLDPATGLPILACGDGGEGACDVREGFESHDLHFEALLSYEPSPGTVFFVGYSRDMEDPEAFGLRDLRTQADGVFLKLSYRFRY